MDIKTILENFKDGGDIVSYQYFQNLENRIILFNDECSDDIIETVAVPLIQFEKDDSQEPVHLYINSEGGSVLSSLFVCNLIDNYSKPLYIHILGYALSMGFDIAIAGKNNPNVHKDCYPFSIFMMHAGALSVNGTSAQTKNFMKFNDKLEAKIRNYVLTHTTIDEETYERYNDDDFWITAEDALSYGVIDTIIGGEEHNVKEQ